MADAKASYRSSLAAIRGYLFDDNQSDDLRNRDFTYWAPCPVKAKAMVGPFKLPDLAPDGTESSCSFTSSRDFATSANLWVKGVRRWQRIKLMSLKSVPCTGADSRLSRYSQKVDKY